MINNVRELIENSNFKFNTAVGDSWSKPSRILLTGATGFLGARLLEYLLAHDQELEVVCLVRGDEGQLARKRLFKFLIQQKITLSPEQTKRITVCVGNIEHAKLGLTDGDYASLVSSVDHIVHSAAQVNSVLPYQQLRAANVLGTLNVAIFADDGKPKRIDAISTLSVFVGSDRCCRSTHRESDVLEDATRMFGGYAASKWAAEFLLRSLSKNCRNRIRYFRPGLLTADTRTGIFPAQDLLTLTVRGLTNLGFVPKIDPRFKVDVTPVDVAAKAMAKLIASQTQTNTFHLAHPAGLSANALFDGIRRYKQEVKLLDLVRFNQQIKLPDASTPLIAFALERALQSDIENPRAIDLFQATETRFDMTNTIAELAAINNEWSPPKLDSAFVDKLVSTLLSNQARIL